MAVDDGRDEVSVELSIELSTDVWVADRSLVLGGQKVRALRLW